MVLAYVPDSRYASEIDGSNWFEVIMREDVEWGHSEPDADPCGYRTLLVAELAEEHYGEPGLYDRLMSGRNMANIRPKSVELISLMQSGHLDYAFEYLSVAVQHDLEYVVLPEEINLGNPDYADFYSTASTEIAGDAPGETRTITGAPIAYGVTLLDGAPNSGAAEAFLELLLSPEGGLAVLDELGQPPFVPVRLSPETDPGAVPESIASLTE
jgi:molybdate/tungstate transport system substrate-binding protein